MRQDDSRNTNISPEELDYLAQTLDEVELQLKLQQQHSSGLKEDLNTTQKNMWDDVAAVPNNIEDLDQLVQAKNYLDEIKIQNIQYGFSLNELKKLRALEFSPYFGRIDFRENGTSYDESIYIGIGSLIRTSDQEFLVYDWRAPISGMYYEYETGPASYDCLEGTIGGEIVLKRQYRIVNGKLQFMFDCNLTIEDETLQEILASSSNTLMRNIVTTIQRNQNQIIRNDKNDCLIVEGTAGSGKTSVALHRIAWLLYQHRDTMKAENIVVVSPNNIFNHYISNVLPSLGEDNMRRMTFKDLCLRLLGNEAHVGDFNDSMELSYSGEYSVQSEAYEYKMSKQFLKLLLTYFENLSDSSAKFSDVMLQDRVLFSGESISHLYRYDFDYLLPVQRLNRIKQRLLGIIEEKIIEMATKQQMLKDRVEQNNQNEVSKMMKSATQTDALQNDASAAQLTGDEIVPELGDLSDNGEYLLQDINYSSSQAKKRQIKAARKYYNDSILAIQEMFEFDVMKTYTDLFSKPSLAESLAEKAGISLPDSFEDICALTIENLQCDVISYEDAIAISLLKVMTGDAPQTSKIKHVVVDEVQDYSPTQLLLMKTLFDGAGMTLLGDRSQTINRLCDYTWDDISDVFNDTDCLSIELNKAYRSTVEINAFAAAVPGICTNSEVVSRHGELPRVCVTASEDKFEQHLDVVVQEFKRMEENGCMSIGILCTNEKQSALIHKLLKQFIPIKLINAHDTTFYTGPSILPVYLAKGLEFDGVIVFNCNDEDYANSNYANLFYTACTRALHSLSVCCYGTPSTLLGDLKKDNGTRLMLV